MTMVTAATFAVLALLGAFQPSTLRNNPLGIISIAIAGSLGNLQLLNMYEESRSVKKSRASLYPFLVLTPAFFLVLIIAVIPNRGMKGPSVQNTTVAGLNIMNCTIATRNIEWSSVCMKTIGKKGALFTQVSQGVLFGSMKRLEAIVLGDALYATVSVLMKTVYGTDDPKSNKCFDFIIRASCGAIFSTCDSRCAPIGQCQERCLEFDKICSKDLHSKVLGYFELINEAKTENHPFRGVFEPSLKKTLGELQLDKDKMLKMAFDVVFAMVDTAKRELEDLIDSRCKKQSPCTGSNFTVVADDDDASITSSDCSKDRVAEYVANFNNNLQSTEAQEASTMQAFVFWSAIGCFFLSTAVAAFQVRKTSRPDGAMFKAKAEAPFSRLETGDKVELFICASVCFFIHLAAAWHGSNQEKLLLEPSTNPTFIGYCWVILYYFSSLFALRFSLVLYSSIIRGLTFLKGGSTTERAFRRSLSAPQRMYQTYLMLFGIRSGHFFFLKALVLEIFEVMVQFFSFVNVASEANIAYVSSSLALMLINVVLSATIMVKREWFGKEFSKILTYTFDAVMDMLYFVNNTWRGGEIQDKFERKMWVNLGLFWPIVSIVLKMRAIYETLTFKRVNPYRTQKTPVHFGVEIKKRLSRAASRFSGVLGRSRKDSKTVCNVRYIGYLEPILITIMSVIGVGWIGAVVIVAIVEYERCRVEFGNVLWVSATPKRMYKDSGDIFQPSCGYSHITTISANLHDIHGNQIWKNRLASLPDEIGSCTKLTELHVKGHDISTLPRPFFELQNVERAEFANNPVATVLNVSNYGFSGLFPQKILCEQFYKTLKTIHASDNFINGISRDCIGRFSKLVYLDVSNNQIAPDGFPEEIVSFNASETMIFFRNNPIESEVVWRNKQNFGGDGIHRAVDFLEGYFSPQKIKSIDLSGCTFEKKGTTTGGITILRILKFFDQLVRLNVSKTGISSLFGLSTVTDNGTFFTKPQLRWERLKILDVRRNDLTNVNQAVAGYAEDRKETFDLRLGNVNHIFWRHGRFEIFPKHFFDSNALITSLQSLTLGTSGDRYLQWKNVALNYFCRFKNLTMLMLYDVGLRKINEIPACFKRLGFFGILKTQYIKEYQWSWPSFLWNIPTVVLDLANWTGDIPFPKGRNASVRSFVIMNLVPKIKTELPDLGSGTFEKLTDFQVYDSGLSGRIPTFQSNSLEMLSLHRNDLEGPFPKNFFGNNGKIKVIRMNWNKGVNGTLPPIHKERAKSIQCMLLHGTSMVPPIPLNYFESPGILTFPATDAQLWNLTGRSGDAICSPPNTCKYGHMICQVAYFHRDDHKANESNPGLNRSKGFLCYANSSLACGKKEDTGVNWDIVELNKVYT
jgi:Leucine-rich repeat (LRR) protein